MVDSDDLCEELYVIGYSFRDQHINEAIKERLKLGRTRENPKPLKKIVIVDYKTNEEQDKFIEDVNQALELGKRTRLKKENHFIFTGANSIEDVHQKT